jgi:hypothetical protein
MPQNYIPNIPFSSPNYNKSITAGQEPNILTIFATGETQYYEQSINY